MGMSESEHAAHLGLNQSKREKLAEVRDMKTKVFSAIPLAIFAAIVMGWDILAQYGIVPEMNYVVKEFFHHLLPLMATYTLFVVGKPYLFHIGGTYKNRKDMAYKQQRECRSPSGGGDDGRIPSPHNSFQAQCHIEQEYPIP